MLVVDFNVGNEELETVLETGVTTARKTGTKQEIPVTNACQKTRSHCKSFDPFVDLLRAR